MISYPVYTVYYNHLFTVSLCVCVSVCPSITDVRSRSSRRSGHVEGPGPLTPIQQVQHPLSVSGEENEYHYTQGKQSVVAMKTV